MYTLKKSHEAIDKTFANKEYYDAQYDGMNTAEKHPHDVLDGLRHDSSSVHDESSSSSDDESSSSSDDESSSSSDDESSSSSSDDEWSSEFSGNDSISNEANTIYEYDGKKYIIDNETFLQKRFDDVKSGISYKMNLCIYKCIRNGSTPYLLYLMTHDDLTKTYVLPNKTNISIDLNDSTDEIEENVMNVFKEKLFDMYPPSDTAHSNEGEELDDSINIYNETLFKGFFLHENNDNSEITMVYDATNIIVPLESNKYCWVSPYEIFVSKKAKSIPISDSVEKRFDEISLSSGSKNNVDFYHLKDAHSNTIIKTPYILFMCKQVESSKSGFMLFDLFDAKKAKYSNVEHDAENNDEYEPIIFPTIQHANLGNYTFFSSSPLTTSNSVKRFAVFVDTEELNPLYVEPKDNDKLTTLYDFASQQEQAAEEQYTSVTFIENSIQFWCIKSPLYFSEMPDILNENIETPENSENENLGNSENHGISENHENENL